MQNPLEKLRNALFVRRSNRITETAFYRVYPYSGRLDVRYVDLRGMCGLDQGFFYSRVPKAANSTVSVYLAEQCGVPLGEGDSEGNWAKIAFPKPSQLSTSQVDRFADLFKFTFVRNPYARVLSAYLDKVRTGKKINAIRSFTEFCRYLDSGGLYHNAHWAPQTSVLGLPLHHYELVGRVESYDHDMKILAAQLGWELPEPSRRAGPQATHADSQIGLHYTDEARAIIVRLYRQDFSELGYPLD